jgi:hypothetical protein
MFFRRETLQLDVTSNLIQHLARGGSNRSRTQGRFMKSANVSNMSPSPLKQKELAAKMMHPTWRAFIQYCVEMDHGEIQLLRIQDGLPVLAEVTQKKVRFTQ